MNNLLDLYGAEIRALYNCEIPALIDVIPADCSHHEEFRQEGGLWRFDFRCNFADGKFFASTVHRSPREAFAKARDKIINQIHEWHASRFSDDLGNSEKQFADAGNPQVLLVDDDEDFVMGTITAFEKVGLHTNVAVGHEELARKIVNSEYDYLLLDWTLNDAVTVDAVLEIAIRLIKNDPKLREKFAHHKPKLIIYSALEAEKIHLPTAGGDYFEYLGHWQKPMSLAEVMAQARKWL
jgi:CheY-like chemotaxis protein